MTDSEHTYEDPAESGSDAPPAFGGPPTVATYDQLRKKRRRTTRFTVHIEGDDGELVELSIRYQAISSTSYDKLQAAHPPTKAQQEKGSVYNTDTFGPALISAVSFEPKMTLAEATELWNSEDWSGGEVNTLFWNAMRLQATGLDVPFNAAD